MAEYIRTYFLGYLTHKLLGFRLESHPNTVYKAYKLQKEANKNPI